MIVDDRQMADAVLVHEMTNVFERIGRTAADQLLRRDQFRNLQIGAGRTVLCNRADNVVFCEHADRGIAFGPDNILDHKRADIVGAHQLCGSGDGFVHSNRHNARGLPAQDVADLHHDLLRLGGFLIA